MLISSPFRVLLVGCGGISREWLSAVAAHFGSMASVIALVDLNRQAAADRAVEFGLGDAWIGTDLAAALSETRPDVAFNCTIPEAHYPTCRMALEAGCDVLVEKPAAVDTREAQELLAISRRVGRRLAVIQNRRSLPWGTALRSTIERGVIGKVTTVCSDFFLGPHFGGFRERMRHVLLLDMAIHTFDQARFLTGTRPVSVRCHEFNPSSSWYAHGASAMATFRMTDGIVFSYRGSWCAPGLPTHWAASWRIIGEKGTLLWDGEKTVIGEVLDEPWDGQTFLPEGKPVAIGHAVSEPAREGHAGMIGDFLNSLREGTLPPTDISDNLYSLAMVEAAVRSAETHADVDIEEMLASTRPGGRPRCR